MTDPDAPTASAPAPALRSFTERRHERRRSVQTRAILTVLDGPMANSVHEVLTRDLSDHGVSFLLRDGLSVGQTCRIDLQGAGIGQNAQTFVCEVVRSRSLSNGRYEMAVKFRGRA